MKPESMWYDGRQATLLRHGELISSNNIYMLYSL